MGVVFGGDTGLVYLGQVGLACTIDYVGFVSIPRFFVGIIASEDSAKEFFTFRRCCLPLETWKKTFVVIDRNLLLFLSFSLTGGVFPVHHALGPAFFAARSSSFTDARRHPPPFTHDISCACFLTRVYSASPIRA